MNATNSNGRSTEQNRLNCWMSFAELLPHFGDFQDAVTPGWSLYHSRISFALNCKMLTPWVIRRVESEYRKRKDEIDISQAEGFIRQILGWREYVRGIYWARMPEYAQHNFFDHQRALPMVLDRGHEDGLFVRCDQPIP